MDDFGAQRPALPPSPALGEDRPAPGLEAAKAGPPLATSVLLALGEDLRGNKEAHCCKAVKRTQRAGLHLALQAPRCRWLRAGLRARCASPV